MTNQHKDGAIAICNAIRKALPAKTYKCACGFKTRNVAQYNIHIAKPKAHDIKICFDNGSRNPVLLEVVARSE